MTDGEIHDIAQAGDKVFVAGTFTQVTSWTGGLARTNGSSGTLLKRTPWIEGEVSTIVADGSGGWYVGGHFERSDGGTCPNLVRVTKAGHIDPRFCARVERVLAAALAGGHLYIASESYGDAADQLVAVDAKTGATLDWTLDSEGGYDDSADQDRNSLGSGIHALASDGATLYVGGFFDALGGERRTHLAAVDGRTGQLLPWNPRIEGAGDASSPTDDASDEEIPYPRTYVGALAVAEGVIYAGGSFDRVDGVPRSSLAAFGVAGGSVTAWAPEDRSLGGGVEVITASDDSVAVATGRFLDGTKILRFPAATSSKAQWARPVDSRVDGLAFDRAGNLVAVGDFSRVGPTARSHAAMLAADGRVTSWDPAPTNTVAAVAADGQTVLLGGEFSGLGGAKRDGLAAFDARSGGLLSWSPSVEETVYADRIDAGNAAPYALAATEERLYVFGDFTRIAGSPRSRLSAFRIDDGELEDWNPDVVQDGVIFEPALAAGDDAAYVSYWFWEGRDVYHMEVRHSVISVDGQGDVRWSTPGTWDFETNALAVSGDEVWLGGGTPPYLRVLDVDTGVPTDMDSPSLGAERFEHPWIDDLAASGDVVYAAGGFNSVDGSARPGLAAFHDGALTDWTPQLTGEFDVEPDSVSVSAGHVYIAGDALSFTAVAGQPRAGIAALTADTAEPVDWPPSKLVFHGVPEAGTAAVVVVGGPTLAIFPLRPVAAADGP